MLYSAPMKFVVILLLIIAVMVAGWLYLDEDARREWLADTPLAPVAEVTVVYKWQDERGDWKITDEPPPAGIEYERLEYHSDTNVMPLAPRDDEQD